MTIEILLSGLYALQYYLSAHVLTCLIPAFFIAGGIAVFISSTSILKYFGPQTKKYLSYSVGSVSGVVLAVCSCTILPLFAGIYRKGAGLGPAITFLYAGPAINLLAIVLTARVLGFELGVGRAIGAVIFSVVIGVIMSMVFGKEEKEKKDKFVELPQEEGGKTGGQMLVFFGILVAILLFGTAGISTLSKVVILSGLILVLAFVLKKWYTREEVMAWFGETFNLVRLIFPILLVGVFVTGMLQEIISPDWISGYVGENTLQANSLASIFGSLMYFSTLTEVPILEALRNLGMGNGPSLTLLLAGPALSLPNMLAIRNIMGTKKTAVYVTLVVVMATITGMIFGSIYP